MTTEQPVASRPALAAVPAGARRDRRPAWWLRVVSVLGGTVLIGLHARSYGGWIIDDAAITFAYARSISDGFGPVLQPGAAPAEAFSNPAWLALLVIGRLFGLFDNGSILGVADYVLFPKVLALLCCAGILVACYAAARKVVRHAWAVTLITGAVLAATPSFVIWSFSGMENGLYGLAVVWMAVVIFRAAVDDRLLSPRIAAASGLIAALAALTRPDGLIYAAAYPIVMLSYLTRPVWWIGMRSILLSLTAFAVPFGGYLGWRIAEFGRLSSLPAVAKQQSVPEVSDLSRIGELVQYGGALAVLAVAALLGMALVHPSRSGRGFVALVVPLALSLVAYAVLKPDWMGELRFATPAWALGALTGTLAVAQLLSTATTRIRVLFAAVLTAALAPSATVLATNAESFRTNPTVPLCLVTERFGRTFNGYADILGVDRASLLAPDLGGTAMTSRLTLVDLAGLAESRIADFWGAGDMPGLRNYVFDEVRPTFIHAHPPWSTGTGLTADLRLDRDYYLIYPDDKRFGDWVRKSAVPGQGQLDALRNYAATTVERVERDQRAAPRGQCGPRLSPGQLPLPEV